MRDEKELFDLSTHLLREAIDPFATSRKIGPAEMVAILTIMLGRIVGKMGFRHMTKEQYWEEIVKHGEPIYALGFDSERENES